MVGAAGLSHLTIRNYIYIIVNKRFEDDIRVSYSKTEIVDFVDKNEQEAFHPSSRITFGCRACLSLRLRGARGSAIGI